MRRLALAGTRYAHAQCDTLRLRLLKLGARVRITVRNVWVSLSQSYPDRALFLLAHHRLLRPPAPT
ncbi:MAG: transposase [Planctomycetes bacterium]|nr:transposase [Planctomycetota bacterium]